MLGPVADTGTGSYIPLQTAFGASTWLMEYALYPGLLCLVGNTITVGCREPCLSSVEIHAFTMMGNNSNSKQLIPGKAYSSRACAHACTIDA